MSIEVNNAVVDSIQTIINANIQKVKYDETIEAQIVQQDSENSQKYLVKTGTLVFEAISLDPKKTYVENSRVKILIPKGDYSNEKSILGLASSGDQLVSEKVSTNKFKDFLYARKFTFSDNNKIINLTGNEFKYNASYDYIGLKINLQSFDANSTNQTPEFNCNLIFTLSNDKIIKINSIFSNLNILGNPTQLLPSFSNYNLLDFILYDENNQIISNDFLPLIKTIEFEIEEKNNILINLNNCEIYFGYKKENFEEQQIKIFFKDENRNYSETELTENIMYTEYYDGYNNELITTYQNYRENDEENPILEKGLKYKRGYLPTDNEFEKAAGNYWEVINGNLLEGVKIQHDLKSSQSKYKAVIKEKDDFIISEEIIFTNASLIKGTFVNEGADIVFELTDGTNGSYNFWGMDGVLMDINQATIPRTIKALLASKEPLTEENGVEKIEWIYPTVATGLNVSYWTYTKEDENNNLIPIGKKIGDYILDSTGKKIPKSKNKETLEWADEFEYTLQQKCYSNYTNNTIKCIVTMKNSKVPLVGNFTFDFGVTATGGTDYKLIVNIDSQEKFLTKDNELKLIANLERIDGDSFEQDIKYKWEWYEMPIQENDNFPAALDFYSDLLNYNDIGKPTKTLLNSIKQTNSNFSLIPASYMAGNETIIYDKNTIIVQLKNKNTDFSNFPWYYNIIKVTATYITENNNSINITEYVPIPICLDNNIATQNPYLIGANRVVYNSLSNTSTYDFNSYNFIWDNKQINDNIIFETVCQTYFSIDGKIYIDLTKQDDQGNFIEVLNDSSLHHLKTFNNKTILEPAEAALVGTKPLVVSILIYKDEKLIWIQPIVTLHNSWNYQNLNQWTGKLDINEEKGWVLAPTIAAGKKNSENQFTGTMLGKAIDNKYGLYGFYNGILRYSFNEDGEAYIGNSDKGYWFKLNDTDGLNIKTNKLFIDTPTIKLFSETNNKDNFGLSIYEKGGNLITNIGQIYLGGKYLSPAITIYDGDGIADENKLFGLDLTKKTLEIRTKKGNLAGWEITENKLSYTKTGPHDSKFELSLINNTEKLNSQGYIRGTGNPVFLCRAADDFVKIYDDGRISVCDRIRLVGQSGILVGSSSEGYSGIRTTEFGSGGYSYILFVNGPQSIKEGGGFVGDGRPKFYVNSSGAAYASSHGNTSSDIKVKNSIIELNENYSIFFDKIKPRLYKYNDGTSGRYHTGFIAQHIKQALDESNLLSTDFGGLVIEDRETENEAWYLRYEEFIALNTWQIQKLKTRVTQLEQEIKEIKDKYEIN